MSDVVRRKPSMLSATRSLRPSPLALFVTGAGVLITSGAFLWHMHREQEARSEAFTRRAETLVTTIQRGFELPLEAVRTLPGFLMASGHVTREEFTTFAASILARHENVSYVEWAPYLEDKNREAFEQRARVSGWPDFRIIEPAANGTLVTAPQRPYYMPLLHAVPGKGRRALLGLDVSFDAPRRARNDHALSHQSIDISPRFSLVEDPPEVGSIAILVPAADTRENLDPLEPRRGIAILIFQLDATIRTTLPRAVLDDVDLVILDESTSNARERVLFESRPGIARADMQGTVVDHFEFLSRTWSIHLTSRLPEPGPSALSLSLAALGVALSLAAGLAVTLARTVGALRSEVLAARQLGQYRLLRKLGEGGMGVVYEAEHALLRRPTAIKVLSERVLANEGIARFEREVHATSQLTHPNTVSIFDFGHTADGVFYYAMEHIAGVTIEALVHEAGPLPPARAVHLLRQIAGSLREAHAVGLVHRDIKPSNIMVCQRGGIADFVKVLDFGLVKQVVTPSDVKVSDAERLLGTPQYMAPEALLREGPIGPSIDIYALGAVAYYMLTGTEVFRSETVASIVAHHLNEAPESPSKRLGRALPDALEALVLRCLAKKADARPSSMDAFLSELDQVALVDTWTQADAASYWLHRKQQALTITHDFTRDESSDSLSIDLKTRGGNA